MQLFQMHNSITTRRSARLQDKDSTFIGCKSSYHRGGKRLYKKSSSQSLDANVDSVKKISQERFGLPPSPEKKAKRKKKSEPKKIQKDEAKFREEVPQPEDSSLTELNTKTPMVKRVLRRSPPPAPRRPSRLSMDEVWNLDELFNLSNTSTDNMDNVTPKSRSWRGSQLFDRSSMVSKRKSTVDASCQTEDLKEEGKDNISQLTERIIQLEEIVSVFIFGYIKISREFLIT